MNWLDDREAADPACPDPGDDPWAAPGYVPDTSRGLSVETAYAIGQWLAQQSARTEWPHPGQADTASADRCPVPVRDLIDDSATRHGRAPGVEHHGRDWHIVRDAEAAARTAGLRATAPQPPGQDTAEWQADAHAWGTGRGVGPDGPEAG